MWQDEAAAFSDPNFPEDTLCPADFVLQKLATFLKAELRQRATWKTGRRNGFGLYLYNTRHVSHVEWKDSPLAKKQQQDATTAPETKVAAVGVDDNDVMDNDDDDDDEINQDNIYQVDRSSTVHELIPLEPPGIATIMTLKGTQDNGIVDREFDIQQHYVAPPQDDDNYPHDANNAALQTAFTLAGQILQNSKCVHAR